jgi:hypothetical protein
MSQFDAHERRFVPELEVLKDWARVSLLLLLAVVLPVAIAYCAFVLVNW